MNGRVAARVALKLLVAVVLLSAAVTGAPAQKPEPQTGHTHDILAVKFSPDSKQLVSYSWGDSRLILWGVSTGRLLWMAKTSFVRKAEEHANLEQFSWSADGKWLVTKSENGTYQCWDLQSGQLKSYSDTPPDVPLSNDPPKTISAKIVGYDHFELHDSASGRDYTVKRFSLAGDAFDISPDGLLFAEGGSWGNAGIKLTDLKAGTSRVLTGEEAKTSLPPYRPGELEMRLAEEARVRRSGLDAARAERAKQAEAEMKQSAKTLFVTFDHFGDMGDPGQKRIMESSEPKESVAVKPEKDANAVWLRLHNESSIPVWVPTGSLYEPDPTCFFVTSNGEKVMGLCDGREIEVWFGLEDKRGHRPAYGFDEGAVSVLLPHTSVLFAVPRQIFKDGYAVRFSCNFLEAGVDGEVAAYGEPVIVRVRDTDARPTKK